MTLTASGMFESKGCGGGGGGGGVGNLDNESNLADGIATNPRTVDTDDEERSEDVCLRIEEGASSVGVLENHDDAWLDSALQSLSLMMGHVR